MKFMATKKVRPLFLQLKIMRYLFFKIAIFYLSLGLHKKRPSYRRSLQPSKESILHFKKWKTYFYFCGSFLPSFFPIRNLNPEPLIWLNQDPIRWSKTFHTKVESCRFYGGPWVVKQCLFSFLCLIRMSFYKLFELSTLGIIAALFPCRASSVAASLWEIFSSWSRLKDIFFLLFISAFFPSKAVGKEKQWTANDKIISKMWS